MKLALVFVILGLAAGTLAGASRGTLLPGADVDADARKRTDGEETHRQSTTSSAGATDDIPPLAAHGRGSLEAVDAEVIGLDRRVIVPIVSARQTHALVLLDIALEVSPDRAEIVHAAMPRLRDAFLSALLDLAASGAFEAGIADPALVERVRLLLWREALITLPFDDVNILILEALMREV
jgi:hypothetical protein